MPLTFNYDHLHEDDILEMNVKIYDFYFKEKFMDVDDSSNFTNVSRKLFLQKKSIYNIKKTRFGAMAGLEEFMKILNTDYAKTIGIILLCI